MSDTYTGTLDPSPSYTLQIGQLFPDNDDRQGSLVEIDALPPGASVDNIFYFNGTAVGQYFRRVIDGPIRAAYCGILPDGSNMTTALQDALNHADITTIVFDYSWPADIVINGTVTVPAGKVLEFKMGNRITGTGTVTGGIIDAPDTNECFASTVTWTPGGTTKNYYSAKWFGAKGDGTTQDDVVIQRIFDFITNNHSLVKPVYFPRGNYLLNNGILGYRWNGTDYQLWTGTFYGELDSRGGTDTSLTIFTCTANMADQFMFGFQRARSVVFKNIRLRGRYSLPTTFTPTNVFRYTKSQWNDVAIRDEPNSPHCCINIDPFSISTPADGGYDGVWTSFYRGSTRGGSSSMHFSQCRFEQAPVGFACSINAWTQNAEIISIERTSFAFCKAAYAAGQAQTKENLLNDIRVWEATRTVIECTEYGEGQGAPPYINGMNIAGSVYSLIFCTAPYPLVGKHIFAESILKLGLHASATATASLSESTFNFAGGEGGFPSADYIARGNWNLTDCTTRYYDNGKHRLKLAPWASNVQIVGGTISLVPIQAFLTPDADVRNANIIGAKLYGTNNSLLYNTVMHESIYQWPLLIGSVLPNRFSFEIGFGSEGGRYKIFYNTSSPDAYTILENAVLTVASSGDSTLTLSASALQRVQVGDYLITDGTANYNYLDEGTLDRFPVLGRVKTIVGTTVTLSGASVNVPVGTTASIPVLVNWIRMVNMPLCCNITNASNVLTNVDAYLGSYPPVGTRLEHPYIPAGVYVTAFDGTARTITLSGNCTGSENDVTIINGKPELQGEMNYDLSVAASYPLLEGAVFTINRDSNYNKRGDACIIRRTIMSAASNRTKWVEPLGYGFRRIDVAKLRWQGASPDTTFYLTDSGKEGLFKYDASDTTTADNGATVIKGSGTVRFKRIIDDNFYDARWFGKSTIYFDTTTNANTLVGAAYRYAGLKVLIVDKQYSWKNGTADADLVQLFNYEVDSFTSGSDTSRTVAADMVITQILVNPASNLAAFEAGTSLGTDDVVTNQAVSSGGWTVFVPNKYYASSGSLYFGGLTSSTQIKIVKMPLS